MEEALPEALASHRVSVQTDSLNMSNWAVFSFFFFYFWSVCILSHLNYGLRSKMQVFFFRADKGQRRQSWRELFHDFYLDLGRYIDYYSTLKKAWDDLKSYLGQKCPRMIASLKGASSRLLISFKLFYSTNCRIILRIIIALIK